MAAACARRGAQAAAPRRTAHRSAVATCRQRRTLYDGKVFTPEGGSAVAEDWHNDSRKIIESYMEKPPEDPDKLQVFTQEAWPGGGSGPRVPDGHSPYAHSITQKKMHTHIAVDADLDAIMKRGIEERIALMIKHHADVQSRHLTPTFCSLGDLNREKIMFLRAEWGNLPRTRARWIPEATKPPWFLFFGLVKGEYKLLYKCGANDWGVCKYVQALRRVDMGIGHTSDAPEDTIPKPKGPQRMVPPGPEWHTPIQPSIYEEEPDWWKQRVAAENMFKEN